MREPAAAGVSPGFADGRVRARLARRRAAERRFRLYGAAAVAVAFGFLALLLGNVLWKGYTAFWQTEIRLPIHFDPEAIDPAGGREPAALSTADYGALVRDALRELFPDVEGRLEERQLHGLVSPGAAFELRERILADPERIGSRASLWLPADDDVDMWVKGRVDRDLPERERRVGDRQLDWIDRLAANGRLEPHWNTRLFTSADSREPERAGILGALVGSFYTMLVTLVLSFPLAVGAAVYLEEFAPRNRWTDLVEVNINNLAAVPSIVFGLLGLAIFLNVLGLPRSAPLVGGLVLTLMTLPTIVIASRSALRSVSPSIREAALGVGASRAQTVTHHVLPLALPGMLTGTILGMAQALGETAPLLMIGMVAFIADVPDGPLDAATTLPVQIFLWSDSPERAFVERTSAAILVLLAFLIALNAAALVLRRKFERRY